MRVGLWGSGVEMKNVEILGSMQRAIAQEAEEAQAELKAAGQLRRACEIIVQNRAGRQRRRMQMITEVGAEQTSMTIMMATEFVAMARGIREIVKR